MHIGYNLPEAIFRTRKYVQEENEVTKKAMELLTIFHLEDHAYDLAKTFPMGPSAALKLQGRLRRNLSCCFLMNRRRA